MVILLFIDFVMEWDIEWDSCSHRQQFFDSVRVLEAFCCLFRGQELLLEKESFAVWNDRFIDNRNCNDRENEYND
jgi:hypothetical protein